MWVDRLPRRPILIVADYGRAGLLVTVPIAYALDALTLRQLFVVGFLVGIFTVFFDVAYQSYLPSLVDREQIIEGNSKLEVSRTIAQISGPGVAGGLIGLITAPYAVLVDAISFFASGAFLTGSESRKRSPPSRRAASRGCAPSSGRGCSTSSGTHCCDHRRSVRAPRTSSRT